MLKKFGECIYGNGIVLIVHGTVHDSTVIVGWELVSGSCVVADVTGFHP